MKNLKYIAVAATTAVSLAACSTGPSGPSWQSQLEDALLADMTESDISDACFGLSMFGADTPEKVGALILAFDEEDALDGDMTLAEAFTDGGGNVAMDEFTEVVDIDLDAVTVRELLNEVGGIMLAKC